MKLKPNQSSYTIKQITDFLGLSRSELKQQIKNSRFSGIDKIQGKLTGIVDDTVYLTEDGTEKTIRCLINENNKNI